MTFVPKKKSDSRPQPGPVNVASTATGASANTNNSNNKSGVDIGAIGSGQQDQPDDQPYQDHDQQQQQRSPQQQHQSTGLGASEKSAHDEISYSGYDVGHGDEHIYDRRQPQHHHHHHHNHQGHQHHHHQQHQNKYMNPKSDNESTINHVILITVINPHYPITCDLIHQICSNYGKVNRIVIFKKNGVQAMVEFDNIESAKRTKSMLHGCDIYSGCCTLKIEFAKPSRLNVHKNDNESFDYTNPNLASGPSNNQAASDSGRHENHHQSNPNHHHPHGHQHHSRRTGVVDRRGRGGGGVNGGGGGNSGSGDSMSNAPNTIVGHNNQQSGQFHPNSHLHQPSGGHHQHSKSILSHSLGDQQQQQQLDNLHQAGGYMMSQADDSLINSNVSTDNSFHHPHQDGGGFNMPRGGIASNAAVASSTHPHGFGGPMDNFIPTSTAQQSTHLNPHPVHGGMYQQRQDGVHPHHHHQHHHHPNQLHHHMLQPRGAANRIAEGGSGRGHNHHNSSFHNSPLVGGNSGPPHHHGTVLMVYGLSVDRINCDRLFNLFCLYGNVVRIKFLRTKEGCAMVQMGDVLGMDRCYSSLNKTILFGNELQISYSKQAFLHDVLQPFTLPDGSLSFKDFMGSKNNRFRNPEVASKNRILPPSRVVHFFNAPHGISDDELMAVFKQTTGYEPVSLKIFPPKDNAKSLSGLVTFRDPAEATEALVLCNHMSIPKAGVPHPYILRLCFSPPTYC